MNFLFILVLQFRFLLSLHTRLTDMGHYIKYMYLVWGHFDLRCQISALNFLINFQGTFLTFGRINEISSLLFQFLLFQIQQKITECLQCGSHLGYKTYSPCHHVAYILVVEKKRHKFITDKLILYFKNFYKFNRIKQCVCACPLGLLHTEIVREAVISLIVAQTLRRRRG